MTSHLVNQTSAARRIYNIETHIPSEESEVFFTAESPIEEYKKTDVLKRLKRLNRSEFLPSVDSFFNNLFEEKILHSKSAAEIPAKIRSSLSVESIESAHEESFFSVKSSIVFYEYIEGAMLSSRKNSPIVSNQNSPILSCKNTPMTGISSRSNIDIKPILLKNVPRTFDSVLSAPDKHGVRIRNKDNIRLAPIDFQKEEESFVKIMVAERLEDLCQDGAKLKCVKRKRDGLLHVIEYTRIHILNKSGFKLEFKAKDLGRLIDLEKPGSKEFVTILTRNGKGEIKERTYISRGGHPGLASIASGFFNALNSEEGLMQAEQKEIEDSPFLGIVAAGTITIKEESIEDGYEKEKSQNSLKIFFAGSSGRYGEILASQIPPHLKVETEEKREWWEDYQNLSRSCIDL